MSALFAKEVSETCDGIFGIFDELLLGLIANVLQK